jgi:hypothetical protein
MTSSNESGQPPSAGTSAIEVKLVPIQDSECVFPSKPPTNGALPRDNHGGTVEDSTLCSVAGARVLSSGHSAREPRKGSDRTEVPATQNE